MSEVIPVRIDTDSAEFVHLVESRVDLTDIKNRNLTRQLLINAGFVFVNRIGGGEKPIINASIPIKSATGASLEVNFGTKVLLTKDELEQVLDYQSSLDGEAAEDIDIDLIRKDMLSFLNESREANLQRDETEGQAIMAAMERIMEGETYSAEDKELLTQFLKSGTDDKRKKDFRWIVQACLSGIDLLKVRNIPVEMMDIRSSKLAGVASPYLDSGFHFGTNCDVTLFPNDPSRTRRLNMVVIHLLSRDLSEMGASLNNSHDQEYATARWYADLVLNQSGPDISVSESDLDLIAGRLLYRIKPGAKY